MKSAAATRSAAAFFSRRGKFVVHTTTLVLKCHFRRRRNTFESLIA